MKDWIGEAALGELAPARERELLAHAQECGECREAYQDARALRAFVDRCVASLVSGPPSPQFEARLRTRLAAEPAPRRSWQLWPAWVHATAGAFAVAALLLVALLWHSPRPANPNTTAPVANRVQPSPATAPPAPEPALALNPRAPLAQSSSSRHEHASNQVRRIAQRAPARAAAPEVLVEPGQFAAIEAYAEATRTGRVDGKEILADQEKMRRPLEIKPIEIKAVDIAPLESADSDAGPKPFAGSRRP